MVDSELHKASGEELEREGDEEKGGSSTAQLVTAHGTYATQSAFTASPVSSKEDKMYVIISYVCLFVNVKFLLFFFSPPLRGYLLDGQFFVAAALASTLTKLTIRYLQQVSQPQSKNVSDSSCCLVAIAHDTYIVLTLQAFCAESMLIIASMLHLGKSGLPKEVEVPLLNKIV